MNIRQSEIPALETVGELRVIEAEQVHHCRMEIVDVDFVLGRIKTKIV